MFTIAYFTLLEALRSRLLLSMILVMAGLFGLAEFLGELSITETREIKAAVTASLLRLFTIATLCLVALGSGLRELDGKGLELILSLPLPRHAYLFGKLTGFAAVSLFTAVLSGLLLTLYAAPVLAWCWALSLFLELVLLTCFSMLCLLTFADITRSCLSVMAFYLLSRSMETLSLMSADPVLTSSSVLQEFMALLVQALALLLPDLHAFTVSDWLVHGVGLAELGKVLCQALLYLVILVSATLFDLYRKNF